jgi:hypothetical protein
MKSLFTKSIPYAVFLTCLSLSGCQQRATDIDTLGENHNTTSNNTESHTLGGIDGVGGDTYRTPEQDVKKIIELLPEIFSVAYERFDYFIEESIVEGVFDHLEDNDSDQKIKTLKTVYDIFEKNQNERPPHLLNSGTVKVIQKTPCLDDTNTPKDATADIKNKTICVDPKRLTRLPTIKLIHELISLLFHEMTHIYGFENETEPEIIQGVSTIFMTMVMFPENRVFQYYEKEYAAEHLLENATRLKQQIDLAKATNQKLPQDVLAFYLKNIHSFLQNLHPDSGLPLSPRHFTRVETLVKNAIGYAENPSQIKMFFGFNFSAYPQKESFDQITELPDDELIQTGDIDALLKNSQEILDIAKVAKKSTQRFLSGKNHKEELGIFTTFILEDYLELNDIKIDSGF